MKNWVFLGLLAICVDGQAASAKSQWQTLFDLTYGVDDNLSQGDVSRDRVEDSFASATLSSTLTYQSSVLSAWSFTGLVEGEKHQDVEGYDNYSVGGIVAFRFQNKLGFTEPFYELSANVRVSDVDVDQRDHTRIGLQAIQTRRLTDRLNRTIGLEYRLEDSEGTVFDTHKTRWFINGELHFQHKYFLYSTYSLHLGEIVSSSFINGHPDPDLLLNISTAADAIETDEVLTEEFGESAVAYRLDAVSHTLSLGTRFNFQKDLTLDASLLGVHTETESEATYQRLISRVTLFKRF